ncbi:MAG: lysophospholipid acyltransferase family protein [Planctomycetota bacterium]
MSSIRHAPRSGVDPSGVAARHFRRSRARNDRGGKTLVTKKAKKAKPIRHRVEYVVFRGLIGAIGLTPIRIADAGCRGLAFVMHRVLPRKLSRYEVAAENLRSAFPDKDDDWVDATIGRMWHHLFRLVVEIVQQPRYFRRETLPQVYGFRQREQAVRALCGDRPVILLGGHFGNWEAAVTAFGEFGFPVGIVARDFDNPYLHAWFQRTREATGGTLISKNGGGNEIAERVEAGGAVALLCDQDAGPRGVFVPFFGRDASTFKSIALLAMQYDALVVVGYVSRQADDFAKWGWTRYELGCETVIDPREAGGVKEITAAYTAALEAVIRRHPEQYFWVHRRWKSVPKARRPKKQAAADTAAATPAPAVA